MVEIKAFCAVRPRQDLAEKIAALPYDVYSRGEAAEEVKKNPFSFLKIDRPEVQFDEHTICIRRLCTRRRETNCGK